MDSGRSSASGKKKNPGVAQGAASDLREDLSQGRGGFFFWECQLGAGFGMRRSRALGFWGFFFFFCRTGEAVGKCWKWLPSVALLGVISHDVHFHPGQSVLAGFGVRRRRKAEIWL